MLSFDYDLQIYKFDQTNARMASQISSVLLLLGCSAVAPPASW
jgi:hypothetical protein